MKKWLFLLYLLGFSLIAFAKEDNPFAIQAENLYKEGNYAEAAQAYEELLREDKESFRLYYNLGNSYFKMGENSKAILNYERALLIKPNDRDTKYNLDIARKQTVDKITVLPELFLVRWYKAFVSSLSADQWARISVALFIVFLVMGGVFLYSPWIWSKKLGFITGIFVLFFTIMTISFASKQSKRQMNRDQAIVMTPSVTVKGSPNPNGTELFIIHEGLKVEVVEGLGNWINIRLNDGNEGWVTSADIERI